MTIWSQTASWFRKLFPTTPPVVTPPVTPPVVIATGPVPTPPAPQPTPVPSTTPSAVAYWAGTNLAGMEGTYSGWPASGPRAGTEYPLYTTATVDYYLARGANIFRLLFSWERLQATLNGPVPAYSAYYTDLRRVVDYATSKGMIVVLEPWQLSSKGDTGGCSWMGLPINDMYSFADFWARMARLFKDNKNVWFGLVNEPNNTSTMNWFLTAQKAIDYIRAAGFSGKIFVPGNGWTNPQSWNDNWYDTATPKRSNAYGWMNANGVGRPLYDPLHNLVVAVHTYPDANGGGGAADVVSKTITRERVKVAVDWARANKLQVFVAEIGSVASSPNAKENWADWISYLHANLDTLIGYTWWAAGSGAIGSGTWWPDTGKSHFSITPTKKASDGTLSGNTMNMDMIGKFT